MKKDPIMEEISDRIRMGIPVGLHEGIAAIEYQEQRRNITSRFTLTGKAGHFWCKLKSFIRFPGK